MQALLCQYPGSLIYSGIEQKYVAVPICSLEVRRDLKWPRLFILSYRNPVSLWLLLKSTPPFEVRVLR